MTGAPHDRAAVKTHDIGLRLQHNEHGERGWEVLVGGGQGRTPAIALTVRDFLPENELIAYLEAIMRVYNLYGRRDNKYKARIKILVHEIGPDKFRQEVESEYARRPKQETQVEERELTRIAAYFSPPSFEKLSRWSVRFEEARSTDKEFAKWVRTNVAAHRVDGYAIANISLKAPGEIPGDASAEQMETVADLADRHSFGEIRISHAQNLVLPHVKRDDLYSLWQALVKAGLGTANYGLASDIIACPGLDYCERQQDIGPIKINISGCINACGHHHVGHIGILGLDKKGEEYYQITLGGASTEDSSIGSILGPGFAGADVASAIEKIVDTYLSLRKPGEEFLAAYRRVGAQPFKEALYAAA